VRSGEDLAGLDLVLDGQPGSVGGQVLGADVAGARVAARVPASVFEGSDLDPIAAEVVAVEVDDTGVFVLPELATPSTYEIAVSKDGFATETTTVNLGPGEAREDVEFLLPPRGRSDRRPDRRCRRRAGPERRDRGDRRVDVADHPQPQR
jgi:hypothetical protein